MSAQSFYFSRIMVCQFSEEWFCSTGGAIDALVAFYFQNFNLCFFLAIWNQILAVGFDLSFDHALCSRFRFAIKFL